MISINEVLKIHQMLISRFGGRLGVRDIQLLESALQRPFQTFEGNTFSAVVYSPKTNPC